MGFLDGLFQEVVPELPIAPELVSVDAPVEVGALYRVVASDSGITLTMVAAGPTADQRFAVKLTTFGTITVYAPEGQLLEADDGALGSGVTFSELGVGAYREWLCDPNGNWLLIGVVDP